MQDERLGKNSLGYPSHFVDPKTKNTMEYCMQHSQAFVDECGFSPTETYIFRDRANYEHIRNVARAKNDPNQYKEMLSLKKEAGKPNTSYRNLNFAILPIAPRLRASLINRILEKQYRINVRAIDPLSVNERRKVKNQIQEYTTNYNQIAEFERISGLQMENKISEEEMAMTPEEIDINLDMNPKDLASLEIKDYITANLSLNNWSSKQEEIAGDLADLGVSAIHVYIDEAGVIREECWKPEQVVANKCLKNDFSDMIRVGCFKDMTVADFKLRTNGSLGEEAYKEMARTAEGGASRYNKPAMDYWSNSSYAYAYDHEKIRVFVNYWFSVDSYTYVEDKNESGNTRVYEKDPQYVPFKGDKTVNEGKGLTDAEFNEKYAGIKTIYRTQVKNVYCCEWVVGTKYCGKFGLMTNMPRYAKSLAETTLPVFIQTMDFMSPFANIEPALDLFQLHYLQFQSHSASSKPPGIAIERNALIKAGNKSGQAGKSTDWKKLLQMYAETGSIVFDGYDANGQPLPWLPIQEMKNGLSPGALEHFNIMLQLLDLIRTLMGTNDLSEGGAAPERLGKSVAQLSMGAVAVNLSNYHRSYKSLYERVCRYIVDLIPDSFDKGVLPGFVEMLGMETLQFFNLNRDLNLREMGIMIEEGPDDIIRERISNAIQIGIEKGELDAEDAIFVEMEDNPYRCIQYIKMKRTKKMREAQQMQQQQMDYQSQKNQEDAAAAGQMRSQDLQTQMQAQQQAQVIEFNLEQKSEDKAFLHAVLLQKMKDGSEMNYMEKEYMKKYSMQLLIGQQNLQKQKLANQKPKPTSTSKK